ncbi:anhydro-N-acetylmuramic acid kinase [Sediminispirochaeta bajacaliforniensis]|uniref:anhydro-N-acetylmuramic acid kinase n=1 Tax=Sediminispirochaeta bajacaliforniensis TaxID=148 RepID=UPI00036BB03D|nr:anhydro-N-acetylmuramic acid kinase [Sediminispirochaeta bajacaliforniensis]
MKRTKAIGLMSGTSVDSIDAAVISFHDNGAKIAIKDVKGINVGLPDPVKKKIFALFEDPRCSLRELILLHSIMGELFAEAALLLMKKEGLRCEDVAVIGSHGQTLYHIAEKTEFCGKSARGSLQVGDGSIIARRTGITTVSDFRSADIAAGGTGAPLVPFLERIMVERLGSGTAFQNIGGIGNVTFFGDAAADPVAFDTGPGNMVVDRLVTEFTNGAWSYDRDGSLGRKGNIDETLLQEWMAHPYFGKKPPKSTGREEFGSSFFDVFLKKLTINEDLIRTAEEFTARSIVHAYSAHLDRLPDKVIVTGGGAHNPLIMESLRNHLQCPVLKGEEAGISSDYKEAAAFALMAYFTINGKTNNIPSATGAACPVVMGKISQA